MGDQTVLQPTVLFSACGYSNQLITGHQHTHTRNSQGTSAHFIVLHRRLHALQRLQQADFNGPGSMQALVQKAPQEYAIA